MGLDRLINIQIDRQTKGVSVAGFGTALFLADDAEKPAGQTSRIRVYDQDSYTTDFASTDEVYKALQAYFSQSLIPVECYVGYIEGTETVTEALDACEAENDDFYAVAMESVQEADQLLLAAWIEARRKIAIVRSSDADILAATTTDIAGQLNAASRERTAVMYGADVSVYQDMAWLGRNLPALPGSITWKFKTLSGVIGDNLSGTAITNLTAKKCNWYNRVGGADITEDGTMASGEFIDVIRGVDFIHARMQEAIFARLVNLPKVPYTNKGADIIVLEMDSVLELSERQGILAGDPKFTITRPDVRSIAFNDRAARLLPDIKFEGVLAGAIHKITIAGVVTV